MQLIHTQNTIILKTVSILPTDVAYIWLKEGSSSCQALFCPVFVRINRFLR